MNFTPITTPKVVKSLFPTLTWDFPTKSKDIYLTFDDGPTPEITNWVLYTLKQFNAKATFFCIGKNVEQHPNIFQQIVKDGHSIGNHTQNHIKGWKTTTKSYLDEVILCEKVFKGQNFKSEKLFRPPYGQITPKQIKKLQELGYKIVMWNVLSIDWDNSLTEETCLKNVMNHAGPGSIIVLHDSVKASKNMTYVLPKILEYFTEKGFTFKRIPG
ncbi:polysaccharide deacetylase family protein [Flavobacteriaceae bacterium S0825]|uniref:polysaccharide deacetylase family protein n=1 Tax=Gaetbulibacter sp. S0825 TaxID=2720084 RepID=UPI0014311256|nr:polysaccharide deacetylase family protein [Gaetbulibacter sp. S0825]MCK0108473.1 polysaccharide deacetylase family protein [Flavobacteriaceae bacterium S0825]NIX64109.1 polysaccharide deacetylase family protein [Gaetbulibacter sp. S0825]